MKNLKIKFVDFYGNFNTEHNHIFLRLKQHFPIVLSDEPDFLFYSDFPYSHSEHTGPSYVNFPNSVKIYTTEENLLPPYCKKTWVQRHPYFYFHGPCDFAMTSNLSEDLKHYRLPTYARYFFKDPLSIIKSPELNPREILKQKTKFCNFLYSNGDCGEGATKRIKFLLKLSKYKQVDSGGKVLNNLGKLVQNKLDFIRPYKFTIAFENSSYPGYVTEKIIDSMLVRSLPIYWGNTEIAQDFNPRSFLNAHDFTSEEALIDRIVELDQNDDLYCQYLSEPYFYDNKPNKYCQPDYLVPFFTKIFNLNPQS